MNESVVAIITARGGSKGLPGKNIRSLAGKPLIAHSILAARNCPAIRRCLVSTEDHEIKKISLQWGAEVIDRPPELATDTSLSQEAVSHTLSCIGQKGQLPSHFVLLQPTSPLRTATHLTQCLEQFFASNYRSAISVTESEHHPYKLMSLGTSGLQPLFDRESLDKPRQLLPTIYRQNGAIYLADTTSFLKELSFFIPPVMPFFMNQDESIDIDNEHDFLLAEQLLIHS